MTHPVRKNEIMLGFSLLLGFFICWEIRHTLLLIYVSIVFAVVFTPMVKWVRRLQLGKWHPSRGVAVLLLIAAVLVVLLTFGVFVIPSVSSDVGKLAQDVPGRIDHLKTEAAKLPFGHRIVSQVSGGKITAEIAGSAQKVLASLWTLTNIVTELLLVILLAAYFIVDGERSFTWFLSLLPGRNRERTRVAFQQGAGRMQNWLRGQALLMLILGSCSLVVFWAIGLPYFYALALFAALANFVPVLGPIATVIVAGAIAATDSWTKLLAVVIFYLIYQQVENSYLTPRIMNSTVELPAVAVIAALAIGSALAGVVGAIVAVPTAALIATLLKVFVIDNQKREQPEMSEIPHAA